MTNESEKKRRQWAVCGIRAEVYKQHDFEPLPKNYVAKVCELLPGDLVLSADEVARLRDTLSDTISMLKPEKPEYLETGWSVGWVDRRDLDDLTEALAILGAKEKTDE